jgi:carbonic anhydrase
MTKESHTWSYVGNHGPAHWGELSKDYLLCSKGKKQSPIDITKSDVKYGVTMSFSYAPASLDSVNTGFTLEQFYPENQQTFKVDDQVYNLVRSHFHVPSQHTVNGKNYPMELHIVHQDDKGNDAIVAIFLNIGKSSASLTNLFANLPESPGVHEQKSGVKIDPNDFLPRNHAAWHYEGSLTHPPCTETLQWYVMQTPMSISEADLKSFTKNVIAFNSRPVQALNGRKLELLK